MKSVVFDIEGEFAHFRKFYTNSSSLSYSVPPRTTVEGLIAAILGYDRDSYYKKLSSDNLHIAVKKIGPTRNLTQTLNYIKATSEKYLNNPKEHTQIPFELITGIEDNKVAYRIYVTSEESYMNELQERLINGKYNYPPSLGAVFLQGYIENAYISEINTAFSEEFIDISSIVPAEEVREIKVNSYQLIKEKMPRDFDDNRKTQKSGTYLFDQRGRSIEIKLKCNYNIIKYEGKEENIVFM